MLPATSTTDVAGNMDHRRFLMATKKVLVRRPSPKLAEGIVTHVERRPVDFPRASEQWREYVSVISNAGWEAIEVPSADGCPDGVFVEDAMVAFGDVAVIAHPGAASRQPEIRSVEETISSLGYSVERITPPGTLEGGDVLKVGNTVYVGKSGRTNGEGIRQFRRILEPMGAKVVAVRTARVLHLKSAVTALPDGTVIGYEPLVDDPRIFERFLPVPEESGSHVICLGGAELLMAADCPKTADLLSNLGYTPIAVDIGEFQKLEGCVTCLSVRLRALPE
jgi:dimethylargininase